MAIKGNKGEWSEFYVFVKLLDERKIHPADENLVIDKSSFYPVLKIFRDEVGIGKRTYDLELSENKVGISDEAAVSLSIVDTTNLKKKVQEIFADLASMEKKKGAFEIASAAEMLKEFYCRGIKTASNRKADIVLSIKDEFGIQPDYGYSIKSMVGSASTLLTNFIYRIDGVGDNTIAQVNSVGRFKDKLGIILVNGGKIKFEKISSPTFTTNLQLIDSSFPQTMAEFLLNYYLGAGNTFPRLIDCLNQENISPGLSLSKAFYQHKVKDFLVNVALGMVPNTEWDSYMKAYGGYIIVKRDGDICCYQLQKRDAFQDYLYNNTKFDTPSTGKFNFGQIYNENGQNFFKLNLQIRFKK